MSIRLILFAVLTFLHFLQIRSLSVNHQLHFNQHSEVFLSQEIVNVGQIPTPHGHEERGWADPRLLGGRMIDFTTKHKGEPLNVIISGFSDPSVLSEQGLRAYAKSLGFSDECFNFHRGARHSANLGDGGGRQEEMYLARQFYLHPIYGTCLESIAGGNHFRAWKQNGTDRNTKAWFLGVSKELKYLDDHHRIAPDGYNLGRDWLVERAVRGGEWKGLRWRADVEWVKDLLKEGNEGINHGIDQDGRVAVLTVRMY